MSMHCKRPGCGHDALNHSQLDKGRRCFECTCQGLQCEEAPAEKEWTPSDLTDDEVLSMASELVRQINALNRSRMRYPELGWVTIELAAKLAERTLIFANKVVGDMPAYARAQERIARLTKRVNAESDETEAELVRQGMQAAVPSV